jgi:hypothetical protein
MLERVKTIRQHMNDHFDKATSVLRTDLDDVEKPLARLESQSWPAQKAPAPVPRVDINDSDAVAQALIKAAPMRGVS